MAKIEFNAGADFSVKLEMLAGKSEEIIREAVFVAGGIVADEVRKNIRALPADKYRMLKRKQGEKMKGVSDRQRKDLLASLGTTPIDRDRAGVINVKIGFDGYGQSPTKKYPKGLPNALLARAIESGSSVRVKHPFVRPAINAVRAKAMAAAEKVVDAALGKIME